MFRTGEPKEFGATIIVVLGSRNKYSKSDLFASGSQHLNAAGCAARPTAGILEASESAEFFRKIAN
jgi:hypothetical protein